MINPKSISDKTVLRQRYKNFRKNLDRQLKSEMDRDIILRLISSEIYFDAGNILAYASTEDEVSTKAFVTAAFANGKRVAFPRCTDLDGSMDFYYVDSVKDLKRGAFGIFEPSEKCRRVPESDYRKSLCIVPGLAFDISGYRLGYGKGYYDRFLSNYDGISVGLCYTACVKFKLPSDEYDRRVDRLITEKYDKVTVK